MMRSAPVLGQDSPRFVPLPVVAAAAIAALALAACAADEPNSASDRAPALTSRPAVSVAPVRVPTATATRPTATMATAVATEAPTVESQPTEVPPTASPSVGTIAIATVALPEPAAASANELPATEAAGSAAATSPRVPLPAPPKALAYRIPEVAHTWQKWNNCGPSAVHMALSAYGIVIDQLEIAAVLKPDREDTNVSPEEIAEYARSHGLGAVVRLGGTPALTRAVLRAGMPLIAEQWIAVEDRGEMGHYRVLTGFDEAAGTLEAMDSYYGPRHRYAEADFAAMWRPFLGAYVLVYDPSQEALARAALGEDWDAGANLARILAQLEAEAAATPGDRWSQFALGEALARVGRHEEAAAAFDRAIAIGLPFRAFWYQFGYAESLFALGRHEQLLLHADTTLAPMRGENLEEWQYWRGRSLQALGRVAEAREAYERALFFQPGMEAARVALATMGEG